MNRYFIRNEFERVVIILGMARLADLRGSIEGCKMVAKNGAKTLKWLFLNEFN